MPKSDFRKFVPEMGEAFHFGLTHKQFYERVIGERGENERRGVEKLLATPFKNFSSCGPKPRRRGKSLALYAR
jgi:hypothetical protein